MNKKFLLAMALGSAAMGVSAQSIDIIKDGKIAEGVTYLEPVEGESFLTEDGDYMVYTHNKQYSTVRFYVENGVDFSKVWSLAIEYVIDEKNADGGSNIVEKYFAEKWPLIRVGVAKDTVGGVYSTDLNDGMVLIEGGLAEPKYGTLISDTLLVYGKAEVKKLVSLEFHKETGDPVGQQMKIKNLKYVANGRRPFYAENFKAAAPNEYSPLTGIEDYKVDAQGVEVLKEGNGSSAIKASVMLGGAAVAVSDQSKPAARCHVNLARMWENNRTDGSGYMDSELIYHLAVPKKEGAEGDSKYYNSSIYIWDIKLAPEMAGKKIDVSFLSKWKADTDEEFTADTDETLRDLPIYVRFNKDNNTKVKIGKTIEGTWNEQTASVDCPAGATSMDIVFEPAAFSYVVDNIRLTSEAGGFAPTYDEAGNVVGYSKVSVASVSSDSEGVAFFEGANLIVNSNEEVVSITLYSMTGASKTVNGNVFNTSAYANGVYAFVAATKSGKTVTGKVVIK